MNGKFLCYIAACWVWYLSCYHFSRTNQWWQNLLCWTSYYRTFQKLVVSSLNFDHRFHDLLPLPAKILCYNWYCNILIHHHFPVHKCVCVLGRVAHYLNKVCKISMSCATHWAHRISASVYNYTCGVMKYRVSENVTDMTVKFYSLGNFLARFRSKSFTKDLALNLSTFITLETVHGCIYSLEESKVDIKIPNMTLTTDRHTYKWLKSCMCAHGQWCKR